MKKFFLFSLLSVLSINGFSQVGVPTIVNDPVNHATLGELLLQAQDQVAKVNKQIELVEKAQSQYEKVNSLVTTLELSKNVYNQGETALESIASVNSTCQKMNDLSPSYLKMVATQCTSATNQVIGTMSLLGKVLGVGLHMSDKERIEMLEEGLNKINMTAIQIQNLDKQTKRLQEKRELLKNF